MSVSPNAFHTLTPLLASLTSQASSVLSHTLFTFHFSLRVHPNHHDAVSSCYFSPAFQGMNSAMQQL